MSARKKSNEPLKTEKIEVRVTQEDKEEIRDYASNLGLSVSALLILCYKMQCTNVFNLRNNEIVD